MRRTTLGHLLVGPPRDIHDPNIFQEVSLVAFFAWVALGSDGLSSSCYGPAQAFVALGPNQHLAVFLAALMALTVFVISASYSQTIELFPAGGGGYLVASRLLGSYAGLLSGCALLVDYVLTISISIASGGDAIFSFFPLPWMEFKLAFCVVIGLAMVLINLRGLKESVVVLLPIFLTFVGVHIFLVSWVFISRAAEIPAVMHDAVTQARSGITILGALPLTVIFMRAYSLGGGTYTGIEAVSNGLPILREPRTVTGKRTMVYMAISLAFIAGGILFAYLLLGVEPETGKTLNAVLFERLTRGWRVGGFTIALPIVMITLVSEGALLFVAAQTGFVGGPQVLATMATDRWVPRRFSNLSERLVTQDGVLAMGLVAIAILIATRASVEILVVLYSINVFVTFTLSQLGMSVHWWRSRKTEANWERRLFINGLGCSFTAAILLIVLVLKFHDGGWVTVLMTGSLIAACFGVRRHYRRVNKVMEKIEAEVLPELYAARGRPTLPFNPGAPTAVVLVNGFTGLGLATLVSIPKLFDGHFRNVVFLGVGEVDSALFKGREEVEALQRDLEDDLREYCNFGMELGFHSQLRSALGTDVVFELRRLCLEVAQEFARPVFFSGKLVSRDYGFLTRFLHNQTAAELQEWLQLHGLSLMILPVQVSRPL